MKTIAFQARWILPISQPPIAGGWVAIAENRIVGVGNANQVPPVPAIDLGDVAILPGLVNAHTHLEFSDWERPIGSPGIKLHDWIGEVVRRRQQAPSENVQEAITRGIQSCVAHGTSLIADITTTPPSSLLLNDWLKPNHRQPDVIFLAEVLGLVPERSNQKWNDAMRLCEQLQGYSCFRAGISPHAPYSTPLPVINRCVAFAKQGNLPLAMHVAESKEERQLIEQGDGPFAERLKAIQVFDQSLFPWGEEATLDLLKILSGAPHCLLVHGNDLKDREIDFVARHPQMSVVYCPRTHAFFEHETHPVNELLRAGVRVAIGTDSLASNPDLSIWREVQWLLGHRQDIPWQTVLTMATQNGADALGRRDLGRLEVGAHAKLLALPSHATYADAIDESILAAEPQWISLPTA